jgi:protein-S-isoprenylcysteine O-methyltransferase Ste14
MASLPEKQSIAGMLVHQVLAHSYLVNLAIILLGMAVSLLFPMAFSFSLAQEAGVFLIMAGTGLILWAQYSSGATAKNRNPLIEEKVSKEQFFVGPYVFTRSPTQYGLTLLALGLACIYGSVVMIVAGIVSFIVGKFFFIPREEKQLALKYGEPYLEYKKMVRF